MRGEPRYISSFRADAILLRQEVDSRTGKALSYRKIAARIGVSHSTVRQWCDEHAQEARALYERTEGRKEKQRQRYHLNKV